MACFRLVWMRRDVEGLPRRIANRQRRLDALSLTDPNVGFVKASALRRPSSWTLAGWKSVAGIASVGLVGIHFSEVTEHCRGTSAPGSRQVHGRDSPATFLCTPK